MRRSLSSLNVLPSHLLGLPRQQLGKPDLSGPDDLLVEGSNKSVERGIIEGLEDPVAVLDPQFWSIEKGSWPASIMGRKGTMISGTVACNSRGADFGFVTSAITNLDSPARSLTVSVKSFVSGLSKLKTIGR